MKSSTVTTTADRKDATESGWPALENTPTSEPSWQSRLPAALAKVQWPDPELSIGLPCCSLGIFKCWEVVGPARDISKAIFSATKDLLDQHSEYLHETEKVPFSITFGLFMIGRNEKNSHPTLLLSCEPRKPRTKALKLVRESGILQGHLGVRLAESSQAPPTLGNVRPLGRLSAADAGFIFFSPPTLNNVCGRPILAMESDNPDKLDVTSVSQKATIGGFIRLRNSNYDDLYCGLTVAHAFEDELEALPASTDVEFAFDGLDGSGEEDDDDEVERNSNSCLIRGHPGSASQLLEQRSTLGHSVHLPQIYQESLKTGGHGIGSRIATSLDGEYPDLDWALIEIQQPHTQPANVIPVDRKTGQCLVYVERTVHSISESVNVLVVTSLGVQTGILSASSISSSPAMVVLLKKSSRFASKGTSVSVLPYYTISDLLVLKYSDKGDSGSWVIDPENGNLYGHIVAGCPESRVGYLIPAYRIFNDIRRQLGGVVELAVIKETSRASALSNNDLLPTNSKLESDHTTLPLGMNQGAAEVIKRFGMSNKVFAEMAIETDLWYQSLIVNPSNLKPYIKKPIPYTWSDLEDKAIYECIIDMCFYSSVVTQRYWDKGFQEQGNCPNWLARWFLYRRFKLAKTLQQKRFGGAHPQDLDYMFIAHAEHAKRRGPRNKTLPDPSRTTNKSTREGSSNVQEPLVGRGKLFEDFSSKMSISEQDPLEEASVTE